MKNIEELYRDVVSWIGELILKDQIWLRDVPQEIRACLVSFENNADKSQRKHLKGIL